MHFDKNPVLWQGYEYIYTDRGAKVICACRRITTRSQSLTFNLSGGMDLAEKEYYKYVLTSNNNNSNNISFNNCCVLLP